MPTSPEVIDDGLPTAAGGPAAPSATLGGDKKRSVEQLALLLFIVVPFAALVAAVPLAWGAVSAGSTWVSWWSCTTGAATA